MKAFDRKEYLQVLFDSILFKDIVKRYSIRQPASLENLAMWLISNITAEFSMNSLSKQVHISSVHTIKKYLNYLEESFVFFSLSRYSFKIGEIQRSNKKNYCYDNGFYRAKTFHLSEDWGKLLENAIASELIRRSKHDGSKLFYWKDRDQEEVDFVVQSWNRVKELIQVCWDTRKPGACKKEIRSLLKASRKMRCKRLTIITYEEEFRKEFNWFGIIREVEFVTAWKWMLEERG